MSKLFEKIKYQGKKLYNRLTLRNKNMSIICSCCIGGMLYHDFRLKFLSPTINLILSPEHFIKFCGNLNHYLNTELVEIKYDDIKDDLYVKNHFPNGIYCPIGKLDDIYVLFIHYDSFQQAKEKFIERAKRINFDNIFLILFDEAEDIEILEAFDNLDYKNKLYMVRSDYLSKDMINKISCKYFPFDTQNENKTYFDNVNGKIEKCYEKFDFKNWFNNN